MLASGGCSVHFKYAFSNCMLRDVTELGGSVNTSSMEYGLPLSLPGVNTFLSGRYKGRRNW